MQNSPYGRPSSSYPVPPQGGAATSESVCVANWDDVLLENLPMVRFVARRIHEKLPQHVNLEDLVGAGVLGLIDAAAKFDPLKNTQFRTYAQFRVRGAIMDSLRGLDWGPRDLRRKGRAIEQAIGALTAKLSRAPDEQEIAEELGQPLEEYQKALGELNGLEIGSLQARRHEDSEEEEMAYIPGPEGEDPLFICLRGEMRDRLQSAIGSLPKNERLVLTLYYYEELTMKEIAAVLELTISRVSQIRSSAILHMRALLQSSEEAVTPDPAAEPDRQARRAPAANRSAGSAIPAASSATATAIKSSHQGSR